MGDAMQDSPALPDAAREMLAAVNAVLSPAYLVGGSVRDVLLGRNAFDFDFTTPLGPDRIESLVRAAGRRPYLVGKKFGTVAFKLEGHTIEVTTFRTETYAEHTRKPDVAFVDDLAEDLSRRDFTINAMALGPAGELTDLFGGRADLDARVVRAVGDARERMREDPLRMLRAARFASQLGFAVDDATRDAIARLARRILVVARERWVAELDKLLCGAAPRAGIELLAETGVLRFVLPELALQAGYDQHSPYHDRTLLDHTLAVVEAVPAEPELRWAALLHDIGKPYMRAEKPGRSTYVGHDLLGGELVERIALYLKWSGRRREEVTRLVREHMRDGNPLHAADDAAKRLDR